MTGKELIGKRFIAYISYCPVDNKIKNTVSFKCSVQRIKGLPAMLFFNFRLLIILSLFIFKNPQFSSNYEQEIFNSLQNATNSSILFNFIYKALKKVEKYLDIGGKVYCHFSKAS